MKNIIKDFKTFFEFANYGFEFSPKKIYGGTRIQTGEKPINYVDSNLIIDEVVKLKINNLQGTKFWENVVQWGTEVGAVKMEVTPLGSYRIVIRKLIKDLLGENIWITKSVIDIDDDNPDHTESDYAENCISLINDISQKNLDYAIKEYSEFERLAWKMWNKCKAIFPSYIMFPVGMKRMDENYYKLVFEFKGHGAEAPTRSRAEQFDIDVYHNKKTGIVKVWGYDIDSDMRRHDWKVQISDFNEWFAPSQPIDEIVTAVHNSLMTY